MNRDRIRWTLDVMSTTAMVLAAAALAWNIFRDAAPRSSASDRPVFEDLRDSRLSTSVDKLFTKGNMDAPLILIEFSDFECPFCNRFMQETLPKLERDFVSTGKVRYALRNFPLERIHPSSLSAAQAAECAGHQGRFWEMRSLLYANQGGLQTFIETLVSQDHPTALGLQATAFRDCLAESDESAIRADIDEGSRLGVVSTPTFLVGERGLDGEVSVLGRIRGALPYAVFSDALNGLLQSAD
jgi:protein-disulfide isomerase